MDISYLGHSCFLLKHKNIKVVTDPFGKAVGFTQAKVAADIVTISHDQHDDHDDLTYVTGEYMVLNGPGEYEIKGVSIIGVSAFHDDKQGEIRGKNTIYVIDFDELRVCHLGDLGHKLTEKQLDEVDGVDVLLIPVGGEYTIGPSEASEVIKQISPAIVIPMHFKTKSHSKEFAKLKTVDDFLKELNGGSQVKEKLTVKKLELPEDMEVMVLKQK